MRPSRTIRVLVVDDSAVARAAIARILDATAGIEVVGMALDGRLAQRKTLRLAPDVITLDLDMPDVSGTEFLEWLRRNRPTPTVILSGAVSRSEQDVVLGLMERGASEFVAKPSGTADLPRLQHDLVEAVQAAAVMRPGPVASGPPAAPAIPTRTGTCDLVVIGASTGGPAAVASVLAGLPATSPAVAVVQHMPPSFLPRFADRLNGRGSLRVRVAAAGEAFAPGTALVAPGDAHLAVKRSGGTYRVVLQDGPRRNYQRPSADVLFESAAEAAGSRVTGVLLTGMGRDGAEGLLAIRTAGGRTVVQDEATSAVFGMGKEAVRLGAAQSVLPLGSIPGAILGG